MVHPVRQLNQLGSLLPRLGTFQNYESNNLSHSKSVQTSGPVHGATVGTFGLLVTAEMVLKQIAQTIPRVYVLRVQFNGATVGIFGLLVTAEMVLEQDT
jgi:hypothetical protein